MSFRDLILGIAVLTFVLVGCGKNDPVTPYGGYVPPAQAPAPPNYAPGGSYSPNQFFPQQPMGNFQPQMPMGMPQQYYPFLPIDNYMRRDPRLQQQWQGMWQQWQGYAQQRRISPYDFSTFWFDYCPQQWGGAGWHNLYQYFDSNFYYWTQPGMQFPVQNNFSATYFWSNAYEFPMPQYDLCDYGCQY